MRISDDVIERLFKAMKNDFGVMAEWGDDEEGLRMELETCDDETLKHYENIYLKEEIKMERGTIIELVKALDITAEELGIQPEIKTVTEKDEQLIHEVSEYIKDREDEETARDYINEKYWDDLAIRPKKKYKVVTVKLQKLVHAETKVVIPEDEDEDEAENYIDTYNIDVEDEDDWEVNETDIDTEDVTEEQIKNRYCEDDIYNYYEFAE